MRVFGLMFSLLSLPLFASVDLTTQIHDIDYGTKEGDEVLVLLKSGHVAKLRETNSLLEKNFVNQKSKDVWYNVTLDDDRYITSIEKTEAPITVEHVIKKNDEKALMEYVPTTIASLEVAKKYFREARYNPKESQCFNRAMVWSYEWYRKHSVRSNKMFIYFTRTYIRRYNFEWWFHVAPLVHVSENGKVVEKMMDRKYSSGPLDVNKWSNLFMRNDAPCSVITKYSEYADFPYTGDCYIQRSNMYTYQPADLQMNEAWGYTKDNFNMTEVRQAFQEAMDETI